MQKQAFLVLEREQTWSPVERVLVYLSIFCIEDLLWLDTFYPSAPKYTVWRCLGIFQTHLQKELEHKGYCRLKSCSCL